jgi:hypothetical protein
MDERHQIAWLRAFAAHERHGQRVSALTQFAATLKNSAVRALAARRRPTHVAAPVAYSRAGFCKGFA